jgi:hypothetical protein
MAYVTPFEDGSASRIHLLSSKDAGWPHLATPTGPSSSDGADKRDSVDGLRWAEWQKNVHGVYHANMYFLSISKTQEREKVQQSLLCDVVLRVANIMASSPLSRLLSNYVDPYMSAELGMFKDEIGLATKPKQ